MRIAIVSPSSVVKGEYIDDAARVLAEWGLEVVVMPHAKGPADGTFAASLDHRIADLQNAIDDPEVDMILCSRGGYGAMQQLHWLDPSELVRTRKPIVGFSDITALHAYWQHFGVPSVHASMAKLFSEHGDNPNESLRCLKEIILGRREMAYEVEGNEMNIPGEARGRLLGGNWAVLGGLMGTPYDMLKAYPDDDIILFLEDISEPIYRVDRLLHQLMLNSRFHRIKGIVFGKFTNYKGDANFSSMEPMLLHHLRGYGYPYPVAFHFPVGHEGENLPMKLGAFATLKITDKTVLQYETFI